MDESKFFKRSINDNNLLILKARRRGGSLLICILHAPRALGKKRSAERPKRKTKKKIHGFSYWCQTFGELEERGMDGGRTV